MSSKRKMIAGSGVTIVLVIVLAIVLGYFYVGFKTPAEQVDKIPACDAKIQRDFIAGRNQTDPKAAAQALSGTAAAVQKHSGYEKSVSCAFIVFEYHIQQGNLSQAQSILTSMKNDLPHDPSYLSDSLLYQTAQSDLVIAQASTQPGTDSP